MTGANLKIKNRTFVLCMLTLVYGFNFIDRQIVGILAPFIQQDLELSDTQLGLLIGFAFALFYTIMGIPLALLADRINRVTLLSASLAIWSGFTALTGFAQNFLHIGLARMGVGIGEAGGSPSSHSIISDLYAKEERAGALGFYALGIPIGIMSAFFITAFLLGADPSTVNWRRIFIILGVSGVILAVILKLVVEEPVRGAMEGNNQATRVPLKEAVTVLLKIPSWWYMCIGISFATFASYAFGGFQTKFIRTLDPDYDFQMVVIYLGIINGIAYAGGTYFGAKLVDILSKRDVRAYGFVPGISLLLAFPIAIVTLNADNVESHLLWSALLLSLMGTYTGPSFAVAQTLSPVQIRATSTALFFFIFNLIGLGGGPTMAGIMIDYFGNSHPPLDAIRLGLISVAGAFVVSFLFFCRAAFSMPKDWADAEARNRQ